MRLISLKRSKKYNRSAYSVGDRPCLSLSSPFAIKEAYNSIRTKLIFTGKGEKCPIFAVTSSLAADGKSTNAVSLAVSIAMANQRVLLIDADMRKPSVHRFFRIECKNGLSEYLAGLSESVQVCNTNVDGLSLITAGQVPPNPAELLGSGRIDELFSVARKDFDYVIIDTPPVNIVTDATVIAGKVTGYIFVAQSGKNHMHDIGDALRQIEEMNGNIVGIILNDPENRAEAHYSHRYNRNYRYSKYKYYGDSFPKADRK